MKRIVRIGSRDSALAIRQAQIVMETAASPDIEFELILIKTTGDKILNRRLDEIGGKGLFIKELEQALIDGSIDIAVHSYKDMPYEETEGLPVVALSRRETPFDALVLPAGRGAPGAYCATDASDARGAHCATGAPDAPGAHCAIGASDAPGAPDAPIGKLLATPCEIYRDTRRGDRPRSPGYEACMLCAGDRGRSPLQNPTSVYPHVTCNIGKGKPVGTSSLRRAVQFKRLYNDNVEIKAVRGNVLTRLSKLDSGEYSALILAAAGLNRLGLQHRISRMFTADEMIPSGSQGILAVQGRLGEDYSYLSGFHSRESEIISKAERQFLKALGGGCTSPAAVYGELVNGQLLLRGMYVDASGNVEIGKISGVVYEAGLLSGSPGGSYSESCGRSPGGSCSESFGGSPGGSCSESFGGSFCKSLCEPLSGSFCKSLCEPLSGSFCKSLCEPHGRSLSGSLSRSLSESLGAALAEQLKARS